jgi:dynein assembly factor 3
MNPYPSAAQTMVAAIGHHGFWGASSTFDFIEAILNVSDGDHVTFDANGELEPLRVLLVHPGDIRHILTTLCRRRRHMYKPDGSTMNRRLRPIEFYLLEHPIEVLARDVLLLEVLFDFEVPIRQRAAVFLEIYGNALVQDRTSRYIERLGAELRELVIHGTGRQEGFTDLSLLKYRERDALEGIFAGYRRPRPSAAKDSEGEAPVAAARTDFDMQTLREHRLRGWYAERYDHRKAIADQDYHYIFKDTCADIIHIRQYKDWRLGGCAFELGDQVYSESNRTMASYAEGVLKSGKDKGIKKEIKGYWGDITMGPFTTFGIDADTRVAFMRESRGLSEGANAKAQETMVFADAGAGSKELHKLTENLFEIYNKNTGTEQHRHHTVEIAMFNLFSYLWELETGKAYVMTKANDIYSGLGAEAGLQTDLKQKAEDAKKTQEMENAILSPVEEVAEEENGTAAAQEDSASASASAPTPTPDLSLSLPPPPPPAAATKSARDLEAEQEIERQREEAELARAIQRAETVVDSLDGVSVKLLQGMPSATVFAHLSKYANFFDGAFVSTRAIGTVGQEEFPKLLKRGALLAVETAKYLVPLNKKKKAELDDKILEMVAVNNTREGNGTLNRLPHTTDVVPRRRRDETVTDVIFFQKA